jgi:hypothetical protein
VRARRERVNANIIKGKAAVLSMQRLFYPVFSRQMRALTIDYSRRVNTQCRKECDCFLVQQTAFSPGRAAADAHGRRGCEKKRVLMVSVEIV